MRDRKQARFALECRRTTRHRWLTAGFRTALACLAFFGAPESDAQESPAQGGALRMDKADIPTPINQPPDVNARLRMRVRREKQRNFDAANSLRIRQISDEATKLLILARDLQSQIQKLGTRPLPAVLIREAEVIEILAHDVEFRMVLSVGAG